MSQQGWESEQVHTGGSPQSESTETKASLTGLNSTITGNTYSIREQSGGSKKAVRQDYSSIDETREI